MTDTVDNIENTESNDRDYVAEFQTKLDQLNTFLSAYDITCKIQLFGLPDDTEETFAKRAMEAIEDLSI